MVATLLVERMNAIGQMYRCYKNADDCYLSHPNGWVFANIIALQWNQDRNAICNPNGIFLALTHYDPHNRAVIFRPSTLHSAFQWKEVLARQVVPF
jgi:hypothetical protein